MKLLFVLVLIAVAAGQFNKCPGDYGTKGWCDCAGPEAEIAITAFTLSPNPPLKGANLTVAITAIDNKKTPITGGNIHLIAKFLGVKLIDTNVDICTALAEANKQDPSIAKCPVAPFTTRTLGITHEVPDVFPSGTYEGNVNITDTDGHIIQCVNYKWKIETASELQERLESIIASK